MWINNKIFKTDLDEILEDTATQWEQLDGARILITGATGLIGSTLVSTLLYYGKRSSNPPKVIALVRSQEKARKIFKEQLADCNGYLEFCVGDVRTLPEIGEKIDYIIHAANQTSSKAFIEQPVETIETALSGTKNMLELAREKQCKGFIYLSSMEVYGYPPKGAAVTEEMIGALTPQKIRNCYPLSKQMCESLCYSYGAEYHIPVKVARLTQSFGPGVEYSDGRIFAEFARCVLERRDIVLKTKGETERSYIYTIDAVNAILTVMLNGENGSAYNLANEDSYCSIVQMAELVAEIGNIRVTYDLRDIERLGYAQTLYMALDTSKLKMLGWKAHTGLKEMYQKMIACFE